MKIPVVFLLLAAGLEAVLAVDKYFEIGGKLSLNPESVPKEGITAIIWKHKGNFVAEWIKGNVPLSYFDPFKGRTDLNTTTGELTINSTRKADEGIFSVEVNSKAQTVEYSAKGITHLRDKKVEALKRPLTCTFSSPHCTLSCDADVAGAEPVHYFWQQDEEQWKKSLKDINITNDEETLLIKTFSCKIKNPISEKNSEPLENPFKPEEQSKAGLVAGIIFLVILIVAGVVLVVFAYKSPEKFAPFIPVFLRGKKQSEGPSQPVVDNVTVPLTRETTTESSNTTSPGPAESKEIPD